MSPRNSEALRLPNYGKKKCEAFFLQLCCISSQFVDLSFCTDSFLHVQFFINIYIYILSLYIYNMFPGLHTGVYLSFNA